MTTDNVERLVTMLQDSGQDEMLQDIVENEEETVEEVTLNLAQIWDVDYEELLLAVKRVLDA